MPASARLGDMWSGICCCHSDPDCVDMTGIIISGSPNNKSGNKSQARLTDITIGSCGHTGMIVSSSPNVKCNNLGKARVGDIVTGCNRGIIVTGNPKHQLNCGGSVEAPAIETTVVVEGTNVKYTEVDFGNADDEVATDDGLNIYPPVVGRPPTPEEVARSQALDVSPTTTVEDSTTDTIIDTTAETDCMTVPIPVPDSFPLTPNFTVGDLSFNTVLSKVKVKAQHGYSIQDIVCNLQGLAEFICEPLVATYGRNTMIITSGFRNGSSTSQHERGMAADIQYPKKSNTEIYNIAIWIRDTLPFDQLILEYGGNRPWIHVSFNRFGNRPASASNKYGTRVSPGNYVWRVLKNMS
jgi:uncharacterized Zn-binding protein involved in type VI secretion